MSRSRSGVRLAMWCGALLAILSWPWAASGLAPPAQAAAPLLDGDIRALALAGDRVAALRDGEVWLLRADGTVIGKAAIENIDHGSGEPHARRRPRAQDVVDLLGLPDDDLDSDLVRQALDDEGLSRPAPRRRDRSRYLDDLPRTTARLPAVLAASRDAIWIAGEDGLQRLDAYGAVLRPVRAGGSVEVRPRALAALAVAPDGRRLAVIAGHEVWRSTDGAGSWTLLAVTPTRPLALALPPDGDEVYVLDEEGVAVLAHRQRFPVFTGHATDLTWCGDELLIAGADGLFAWRWNIGLDRRGARVPARRLTCAQLRPALAVAFGPGLASSRDGGRTWLARADLPAGEIEGVAATAAALWVGTSAGLYLAPLETNRSPPVPAGPGAAIAIALPALDPPNVVAGGGGAGAPLPAILRWRASWWRDLLPAVSLLATRSHTSPGADRGAVWLLLTVPLGESHPYLPRAVRLARDLLRHRAESAAALARAALLAPADDEAAALARLAGEELREAPR